MTDILIFIFVVFIAHCFNETGKQLGKIISLLEKMQNSEDTADKVK